MELEVVEGDITALAVDAIANAANDHLWMGAGVAGAIKRAGGDEIERDAVALGPIEVGDAVATGAGRLRATHVIHGAVMGQDLRTDGELVRRATRRCLEVADELGAESLALPAFGTGVGGFPVDECARIMSRRRRRSNRGRSGASCSRRSAARRPTRSSALSRTPAREAERASRLRRPSGRSGRA